MKSHAKARSAGSTMRRIGRPHRPLLALLTAAALFASLGVLGAALAGGPTAASAAAKPTIEESPTFNPSQTTATLADRVNPNGEPLSDCHFVYGAGTPAGHEVPCEELPDFGAELAIAKLSGLAPGTEYSYRLVASNAAGAEEGPVQTFRTTEPAAAQTCSNEAIRQQQHTTALADCRAYERVSPAEKGNSDVVGDGITNIAAAAGNAVTFNSRASFGDTVGSGVDGQTQYLARRGESGWASHAIDPTPNPEAAQIYYGFTKIPLFSEDLGRAILWAYDLPGVEGDIPSHKNIYREQTSTGALLPVTSLHTETSVSMGEFINSEDVSGLSADAEHVLFKADAQLLPEAVAEVPNVYEWTPAGLRVASVLPDGTLPPRGAVGVTEERWISNDGMSSDGSRALFLAPARPRRTRQLYMRIGGERTVWISEPQLGASPPELTRAKFQAMTPDGRNVFFVTESQLLPEDTNEGPDLYRWTDAGGPEDHGVLTMITTNGGFEIQEEKNGVVGVSDDGSRVYYQTTGGQLNVWDNGTTRLISDSVSQSSNPRESLAHLASDPGLGRVSPDGRWLAFVTEKSLGNGGVYGLTGQLIHNPRTGEGFSEMYLYDLRENTLSCVSCSAEAHADASVTPALNTGSVAAEISLPAARPHFLTDGGTVFFSTAEALSPADVNGVADTYQFNPAVGKPELVSSGKGTEPAMFVDAGAGGRDVFLVTRRALLASDSDGLIDLYDARSGGGFAEPSPPPSPCLGEACKPPPSTPPTAPPAASTSPGSGNHRQHHRRCRGKRCHRRMHRHLSARGSNRRPESHNREASK